VYFLRHDGGLTLNIDGKQSTISSDVPHFARLLVALKARDFEKVEQLMNVGKAISTAGLSRKFKGRSVFVENGKVFYTDSKKVKRELHGALVKRIMNVLGKPQGDKFADALMMFLDNIMKNKVKDIRAELYEFLMSGDAPITYDGCFLAYKKVKSNFKDGHTGTMDNSPGQIVRIPQDQVDRDRNNECSRGLHFASLGYLSHYGAGGAEKVVIVKVNPRHVFAIPRDYDCQKGRASEYFVVGEYKNGNANANEGKEAFRDAFIDEATKTAAAPDVEFSGSLVASLETKARSYGMVFDYPTFKDGAVYIIRDQRDHMVPVKQKSGKLYDIKGNEWRLPVGVKPDVMSVNTRSVRAVLKKAIAQVEK
jgi:hypothetical protein